MNNHPPDTRTRITVTYTQPRILDYDATPPEQDNTRARTISRILWAAAVIAGIVAVVLVVRA